MSHKGGSAKQTNPNSILYCIQHTLKMQSDKSKIGERETKAGQLNKLTIGAKPVLDLKGNESFMPQLCNKVKESFMPDFVSSAQVNVLVGKHLFESIYIDIFR